MLPEKHLRDLESSAKKSKFLKELSLALLFFASFVLFGPLIHEISHFIMLELINCAYTFSFGFKLLNGFHAQVSPLCAISPGYLLGFYSIGYLNTLIVGSGLNILGSMSKEKNYASHLVSMGTGLLLSVTLTIGIEGDIQNALEVMNLSQSYGGLIALIVVLGVLSASVHGIKSLIELERKE